jgi:hypothetical protein
LAVAAELIAQMSQKVHDVAIALWRDGANESLLHTCWSDR